MTRSGHKCRLRRVILPIAAKLVVIAASLVFALASSSPCRAQSQSRQKLTFEIASIKEWQPKQPLPAIAMGIRFSTGRVYAPCSDLWSIVRYAYHLALAAPINGLPNWARALCGPNSFSIDATMPDDTTEDQARQMMQSLLEDRFKMRVHWEKKDMQVFILTIAPGGFKGAPYDPKTSKSVPFTCPEDDPGCGQVHGTATIPQLANSLGFSAGRLIIDKTGLNGRYETNFMYASDRAEASSLPSLSTVLREKLGLLLKPQTAAIDVLVVDHVEKPSPN